MSTRQDAAGSTAPELQQHGPLENSPASSNLPSAPAAVTLEQSGSSSTTLTSAVHAQQEGANQALPSGDKSCRKRQLKEMAAQLEAIKKLHAADLHESKQVAEKLEAANMINEHLRERCASMQNELASLTKANQAIASELTIAKSQLCKSKVSKAVLGTNLLSLASFYSARKVKDDNVIIHLQSLLQTANERVNALLCEKAAVEPVENEQSRGEQSDPIDNGLVNGAGATQQTTVAVVYAGEKTQKRDAALDLIAIARRVRGPLEVPEL
jgi:hypothetical protein